MNERTDHGRVQILWIISQWGTYAVLHTCSLALYIRSTVQSHARLPTLPNSRRKPHSPPNRTTHLLFLAAPTFPARHCACTEYISLHPVWQMSKRIRKDKTRQGPIQPRIAPPPLLTHSHSQRTLVVFFEIEQLINAYFSSVYQSRAEPQLVSYSDVVRVRRCPAVRTVPRYSALSSRCVAEIMVAVNVTKQLIFTCQLDSWSILYA